MVLSTVLALVLAGATASFAASEGSGSSDWAASMPHGAVNNYSIHPESHQPGEQHSIFSEHTVFSLEGGDDNEVWIDETNLYRPIPSDCQVSDLDTLGIDRNNTYRGTHQYDDDQIQSIKESTNSYDVKDEYDQQHNSEPLSSNPNYNFVMKSYVNWAEPSDPQPTIYFSNRDRFVVVQNDCFTNPEQPGWYRWVTYSTVEYEDGHRNEPIEPRFSHWYYVCDCDNEQQARNKLGPPPSEEGDDQQDDQQNDQQNDTATDDQQNDQQDDTATDDQQNDQQDDTATDADGDDTATDVDGGDDTPTDTADEGQPGFGVAAALVALLGIALLAARRRG